MPQHHLDRDQLASLLSGGLPDPEERRARAHLFSCAECEARIADSLGTPLAWREAESLLSPPATSAPSAPHLHRLTDLSRRLETERQDAKRLFARLETEEGLSAGQLLRLDPGFGSWGFFERLIEESRRLLTTAPHRAHTLLKLAVGLATRLDTGLYGQAGVETAKVRGWTYLGNIERVLGDFEAAEKAFRRAEFHYWQSDLDPLDEALLLEYKAALRRHQSRFAEALELADGAIDICREVDERHMEGRVGIGRAVIHLYAGRPEEAAAGFGHSLRLVDAAVDPQLPVACLLNQILCLTEANRAHEAEALLPEIRRRVGEVLLGESDHLNLRLRWIEARVDLGLDRLEAAESAFRQLQDRFLADKLPVDAAFVTLDLAALLVRAGRTAEVRELMEETIPVFQSLQIQREVLASLVVLGQAAQAERLTLALLRETVMSVRLSTAGVGAATGAAAPARG